MRGRNLTTLYGDSSSHQLRLACDAVFYFVFVETYHYRVDGYVNGLTEFCTVLELYISMK